MNLIIFNSSENNDVEVELHSRAHLYPILHGLFISIPLLCISLFFAFGSRRGSHKEWYSMSFPKPLQLASRSSIPEPEFSKPAAFPSRCMWTSDLNILASRFPVSRLDSEPSSCWDSFTSPWAEVWWFLWPTHPSMGLCREPFVSAGRGCGTTSGHCCPERAYVFLHGFGIPLDNFLSY